MSAVVTGLRVHGLLSERALRGWAVASLVANIALIVTGGVVRLTGSGLGCPTWPECTVDSMTPTPAMGIHGVIEFSNRMLFFVLGVIAVCTFLVALAQGRRGARRRDLIAMTLVLGLGIPFQGVIGGITVLTKLNPYAVGLLMIFSLALICCAVWLVRRSFAARPTPVAGVRAALPPVTFVAMAVVVWLGTVVTGSGPHAGDASSPRTGLNIATVAHAHAAAVYVTVALTIGCLIALRSRAAAYLLIVEVCQAIIGFVQYFNALPAPIVELHLLGAALSVAAAANLLFGHRPATEPRTTSAPATADD